MATGEEADDESLGGADMHSPLSGMAAHPAPVDMFQQPGPVAAAASDANADGCAAARRGCRPPAGMAGRRGEPLCGGVL